MYTQCEAFGFRVPNGGRGVYDLTNNATKRAQNYTGGFMQKGLRLWHEYVEAGDLSLLPEMFTEDCVFISPVVHTPQRGKDITVLYLSGAMHVLKNEFRYLKEIVTDTHAALEFECKVDDIIVNGIDILTFGEDGLISEFKVMVRPLQAMNKVHAKMGEMLEALKKAKAAESAA